jgi:hypothetical protein
VISGMFLLVILAAVAAIVARLIRAGVTTVERGASLYADDEESRAALRRPMVPPPVPWSPPAAPLPDADVRWMEEMARALIERRPASSELSDHHLDAWARVATRARDESGNAPLRAAFAQLSEASQRTVKVEAFQPPVRSPVDTGMMDVAEGPAAGAFVLETLRLGLRSQTGILRKAVVRTEAPRL